MFLLFNTCSCKQNQLLTGCLYLIFQGFPMYYLLLYFWTHRTENQFALSFVFSPFIPLVLALKYLLAVVELHQLPLLP